MKLLLPLLVAVAFTAPALAHEGEDHGAPPPTPASEAPARSSASTGVFELVAVASGGRIVLYVDRFATNEPISGARIEVQGSTRKASAEEVEPGVYRVAADEWGSEGTHPLTVDVEAGGEIDLLSLSIEGASREPRAATPAAQPWKWQHPLVWGASGAVLLAGAGVVAMRRKGNATDPGARASTGAGA